MVSAFEVADIRNVTLSNPQLICTGKGVAAYGYEATQGFVVKAGSQGVLKSVPSMQEHVKGMYDLRADLIRNGVLMEKNQSYVFAQDYTFSSPSTAVAVVLGRSANGRVEWKDKNGRTLKDLQNANSV